MAVSGVQKVMDSGLFERMLKELRIVASDDESVVDQLATAKILSDFAKRICSETKKDAEKISSSKKRRRTTAEDSTCTRLSGEKRRRDIKKRTDNIRQKKPVINFAEMGLDPPPNLSTPVRNYVESKGEIEDLTLVIMKPLFGTDLSQQQARLSIPFSQVLGDFLRQEEKVKLDSEASVEVTLIPPCLGEEVPMLFKKYSQLGTYRLISGWNSVLRNEQNAIKEHDIVQLWSFRRQGELRFVLVKVRDGGGRGN